MSDILNMLNKNRLEDSLITTSSFVISKSEYKSKNIFQKFKFHIINGRFLNKDVLADLIANKIDEHINKSKKYDLEHRFFYILVGDAKNFKDKIKINHPQIAEKLEQVFQRYYYQELLIDINNGTFSDELINNISKNKDIPENIRKRAIDISALIKMIEERLLDNIVMISVNKEFLSKENYPQIDSLFIDLYNEAPIIRKKVEERNQKIQEIKDKVNQTENWRDILGLYSNESLMTAHLMKYIEDKILNVFKNETNLYSLFTELDSFIDHSNFESFPDEVKECAKKTLNKYIDQVNDLSKNDFKLFEEYLIKLIGYLDVKSYPSAVRMVAQDKLITHISQISNSTDLELYQIEDLIKCNNIKVSSDYINAIKNIIIRKKFQLFAEESNNMDAQQAKELIGRNRSQKLASDIRKEQIDKEINNLNILISNLNNELDKEIENLNNNHELSTLKMARDILLNKKYETEDQRDLVSRLRNISSDLYKKAKKIIKINPDNRINEIESRKTQLLDQIQRNTQRKIEFAKEKSDIILNERQNYFNEIKEIANKAEFTIFLRNFGDIEKSNSQLIQSLIGNIGADLIAELRSIAISTFIAKIDKGLFDEQIKNMSIKANNNVLAMQSMDSLRMLPEDARTVQNLEKITTIVTDPRLIDVIQKRKSELPASMPLEFIPIDNVSELRKNEARIFNANRAFDEEDIISLNLDLIEQELDSILKTS